MRFITKMWMEAKGTVLLRVFISGWLHHVADTVLAVLDMMFQFVRVRQQWHLDKSRLTESSLKWMAFAYQFQGALNHGLHKRIPCSVSYKKRKKRKIWQILFFFLSAHTGLTLPSLSSMAMLLGAKRLIISLCAPVG